MDDPNLFMMCSQLNKEALIMMPEGFTLRPCRKEELSIWKAMPFDDAETALAYEPYMQSYFELVYQNKSDLFFERCLFLCDADDQPIGTAFIWPAYDKITTLHWVKVKKGYEDKKLGRAMLSVLLGSLSKEAFPIYLHTQPGSYRAIKLYSDFGFKFITDEQVGARHNDLSAVLPELQNLMTKEAFNQLQFVSAPADFLNHLSHYSHNEF